MKKITHFISVEYSTFELEWAKNINKELTKKKYELDEFIKQGNINKVIYKKMCDEISTIN